MKRLYVAACAAIALTSATAWAAAPDLRVTKSVTIDAPVDKVWSTVKDFNNWPSWHPALASDEIVEGSNGKVGAVRVLTLKGGGTIKEKLLSQNDMQHSFSYTILESVLPVSDYTSHLKVKAMGADKSTVTWSGKFKRKDTGENPGEKENDKAATGAITGVYQSGLDNLKKVVEGK
jgi:mxaD protein